MYRVALFICYSNPIHIPTTRGLINSFLLAVTVPQLGKGLPTFLPPRSVQSCQGSVFISPGAQLLSLIARLSIILPYPRENITRNIINIYY